MRPQGYPDPDEAPKVYSSSGASFCPLFGVCFMATLPLEQAQQDVAGIFLSYFNRAPEYEAMAFYVDAYNQLLAQQGDDPAAHPNAFKTLSAAIYVDGVRHGEVPGGSTISNAFYVDFLYENVLGREPDQAGLDYWVSQLDQGTI